MERIGGSIFVELNRLSRQAATDDVIDAAVSWNLPWANLPSLEFLLAEDGERYRLPAPFDNPEYHRFDEPGGAFFISRWAPVTQFFYQSVHGGGACGGQITLAGGERYTSNGGWSSNAGAINRLRAAREDVRAVLPEEIVEATYHKATWAGLGMAGVCWDLSFAQERVARYCPGVELLSLQAPADDEASTDQSLIVYAGSENAPVGSTWIPYPLDTPGVKPQEGGALYQATSAEVKQKVAQDARALARGKS